MASVEAIIVVTSHLIELESGITILVSVFFEKSAFCASVRSGFFSASDGDFPETSFCGLALDAVSGLGTFAPTLSGVPLFSA